MSKIKENSMFGKKRSKLSVLPVIFSSVLAAGALAGSAVSVWHVSKNYQESAEFTKSFNARVQVDPVAFEAAGLKTDKTIATNNLKESASRLSAWLKYNGAQSYDVSYELGTPDQHDSYENAGWLSANFSVSKVDPIKKTEDHPEKIFNDPYLAYFAKGGINTNNRTLVYRWCTRDAGTSLSDWPRYTLLDFKDIFDIPTNLKAKDNNTKTLIDKDGKSGVLLKIKEDKTILNEIYSDLKWAAENDKDAKLQDFQKPRLYIINNIEQMFNEVNYHLMCYSQHLVSGDSELKDLLGIEYTNLYEGKDQQKFASTVRTKDKKNETRGTAISKLGAAKTVTTREGTTTDLANAEALNYLDLTKYGSIEASFLNKYVDKTFLYSDKNYQGFFPDKITDTYTNDEASTKSETDLRLHYAWYSTASTTVADTYLEQQVNYGLKCKIVNIVPTETAPLDSLKTFVKSFASREVPPKFVDTIFGGNKVIAVLCLGFLIYLIALGIILALLYRTTGVMSWICMMFMLSMSGLIATLGSGIISMSLLFGLFALSIVGFISALAICGRIKRRICSNEDTSVAVIKGLKKALWPLVDISFITLLFGICFTYIAPITLNPLGVVLIIGAFATFISMYLINSLLMLLFFNNGLTMNKFIFLGRPNNKANDALAQSNSYVPSSLDATKLEFAFYDRMSTTKFSLINLKTLIVICVFGALLIAGIVVFSVQGLARSSLFHSSMCVVINSTEDVISKLPAAFKYTSYQHYGNWWYFYCDVLDAGTISAIQTVFADAQFGNIIGNTNKDILNFALLSILITVICAAVYTGLRSNWTAFVPMLAGSLLVPLLMIGVASIAQIKFDENVVLGFAAAVVFNTLISNTIIASINESWFRKESYSKDELKFIVTASAKNSLSYVLVATLAYALFVAFFGVCGPLGILNVTWMMLIGGLVTLIVTPILVTYLLYWFLVIRAKALTKRANRLANKVYVNMDEIDEQSIEGINKFTKVKAYAKKPQQGETK